MRGHDSAACVACGAVGGGRCAVGWGLFALGVGWVGLGSGGGLRWETWEKARGERRVSPRSTWEARVSVVAGDGGEGGGFGGVG